MERNISRPRSVFTPEAWKNIPALELKNVKLNKKDMHKS